MFTRQGARGELFELAPGRLEIVREGRVWLNIDAFKKDDDRHKEFAKQLWEEVPDCFHEQAPVEASWIHLDPVIEHHLAADLEPRWLRECSKLPIDEALKSFAADSVNEIGNIMVWGVGSGWRVQLDFLGSLQWDGHSKEVSLIPSSTLLEHLRMPQLRHLLKRAPRAR